MMSSRDLKNQMKDTTKNQFQDKHDDLNNTKASGDQGLKRNEIEKIENDFNSPIQHCENDATNASVVKMLRCDAIHDGKCEGEIKKYGNRHFNCLLAGEYHNFCNYHYRTATYCPAHPCFNKITRT